MPCKNPSHRFYQSARFTLSYLLLLWGLLPGPLGAATYTVTNTNDAGAGSLRQAILDANANAGPDIIMVPASTYVLASDLPTITDSVTISGAGVGITTIDGTAAIYGFAVGSGIVAIRDVAVQNGGVMVSSTGTLGGTGSVGAVTVNSGGTLAPGSAIGTINTGNLTFNAGSVYEVEVDAAGNSDRTSVTGTVSLGGATLSVLAENGAYATATDYLIINNDGADAVAGTFGSLTSNLAFLDPSVNYTGGDGNDVILTMTRNHISYSEVALTDNQRAVARALEATTPGASGDMADVITAVTGLSAEGARSAYDQMGGAGLAAFYESDLSAATRMLKTVSGRLTSLRADTAGTALTQWDTGPLLAANDTLASTDAGPLRFGLGNAGPLAPGADWGVWGRGLGVWGDRDGRDVAEQYDYTITGATLGMDRRLGDSLVAGISVGYVDADLDYDQLDDSATSRGWETTFYGAWMKGPWYVDAMAAYARNAYDTKRHIAFGGIDRVAEGDFDGDVWSAYLESGCSFDWQGLILQPLASLQMVYMDYDSYTETGAGALNLVVDDGDATSVVGSVGLRLAKVLAGADGGQVVPEARVRWAHEFSHDDRVISAGFAGAPAGAGSFRVDGDDPVRDRLILGCGLTALYNDAVGVYLNYDAALGDRSLDHALSLGLRVMW